MAKALMGLADFLTKLNKLRRQQRLIPAVRARMRPYVQSLPYIVRDPAGERVVLHCPEYVAPSQEARETALVERIFRCYRRMKADQQKASDLYMPSSVWQSSWI